MYGRVHYMHHGRLFLAVPCVRECPLRVECRQIIFEPLLRTYSRKLTVALSPGLLPGTLPVILETRPVFHRVQVVPVAGVPPLPLTGLPRCWLAHRHG